MVDLKKLIGTPFEYGGRGPDTFDCYGLVMHLFKVRQGITLPDYNSPSDQAVQAAVIGTQLDLWKKIPQQADVAVLLRLGRHACHCGYMVDNDHVAHAVDSAGGVLIQRIDAWERRILGFYRYVG